MESVMAKREKRMAVPAEMLSKEFLSQFKTEKDVSRFLKDLHSQVLEQILQGEMDAHLGYEKHSTDDNNTGNSRNGSFTKKIQSEHGESIITVPRDRNSDFTPIVVPKHESRGLSSGRTALWIDSIWLCGWMTSCLRLESQVRLSIRRFTYV